VFFPMICNWVTLTVETKMLLLKVVPTNSKVQLTGSLGMKIWQAKRLPV